MTCHFSLALSIISLVSGMILEQFAVFMDTLQAATTLVNTVVSEIEKKNDNSLLKL